VEAHLNRFIGELLTAKSGDWRVDLMWRAFGWSLYQSMLQYLGDRPIQTVVTEFPWALRLLGLSGLALVALGARVPVLVLTAAASICFMVSSIGGQEWWTRFPAEESPLQVGLSLGCLAAVVVAMLSQRGTLGSIRVRKESARFQLLVARSIIVIALGFAGLAKLNTDFFDPRYSCTSLTTRLDDWWVIAQYLPTKLGPTAVVALELAVPLMLCLMPRVGILLAVFLGFGIGHIGPTAFNATAIALSLSFLRAGDRGVILRWLRRGWPFLLVAAMILMPLSSNTYRGDDKPWHVFAAFEAYCFFVAFVALAALSRSIRGVLRIRSTGAAWAAVRAQARPPLPHSRAARALVAAGVAVLLLNGMCPYLGLKFRFSHAMLSNLRVDENRWNHYVMPRWLYLRRHDPFVHVTRVEVGGRPADSNSTRLRPALFRPDEFKKRCAWQRAQLDDFLIEYSYLGEKYRSEHALSDNAFWQRLDDLRNPRLIQAELAIDAPQPCRH